MSAVDLGRSPRTHRDKGKARAIDPGNDCLHPSSSSYSACSSASASQCTTAAYLAEYNANTHADNQSNPKPKAKGKGKQQASEVDLASPGLPPLDLATPTRRSRRVQAAKRIGSDELSCQPSFDTPSHKRSLRDTGTSPPHSPHQLTEALAPVAGPSCPTNHHREPALTGPESPHTSRATPASGLRSRFNVANKKRRSHMPDEIDMSLLSSSASHHPQPIPSARTRSPALEPHTGVAIRPRRPSLLVNSGTAANTLPSDSVAALCESPEPIDDLASSLPSRRDQSELRSAHLAESRAQRSLATLRRRRGFYSRDASSPSPGATIHHPESLAPRDDMLSGSSSLRLPENASERSAISSYTRHTNLSASDRAFPHHRPLPLVEPSDHMHRDPPQLPHVRVASPLAITFASDAEHETPAQSPLRHLTTLTARRRTSSQVAPSRQDDADASSDHSSLFRSAHRYPSQPSSLRQDVTDSRAPTRTITGAHPTSERYTPYQSHDDRPRAHVRFNASGNAALDRDIQDDRSPSMLHRRIVHLHSSRSETTGSMHDNAEPARDPSQRREATDSLERLREPTSSRREPLPWRSGHFGLRTPLHASERQTATPSRYESLFQGTSSDSRRTAALPASRGAPSAWTRQGRNANESALEYLGRLMSHDSMLDEWMAGDVHASSLRMAIESETWSTHSRPLQLGLSTASSSMGLGHHGAHLALDARNFIADEDWAELNSYEALMQLSDRLGAAEVCVPASLVDALPTCEYAMWDGGSCAKRDVVVCPEGKGKQKVEAPPAGRDTMCPICREDYVDADVLMSINTCHHAFHAHCIRTWFKKAKTCPLCRADAFDGVSLPALPFASATAGSTSIEPGSLYPPWSFHF